MKQETNKIDIPRSLYNSMKRAIKPDVPPGEFKCRTCDGMWSSFMENNIPCTMTAIRNGLHDFDFGTPILVQSK
jgi:hypothetical protein